MTEIDGRPRDHGPLRAEGLRVAYGPVVALDDVSVTVRPGEFVSVTGPSGAGKSSLLWALGGALRPKSGEVTYAGGPVGGREKAAAAGIVLVPQGNGLATTLTASENSLVPLLTAGVDAREAEERVQAALSAVGLEESGNHLIEELSGGQQQRVAVARALARRGSVILADEPTSDLDSLNRERMIALLRAEADDGALVIMATHDPDAAAETDAELALDDGAMRWARPLAG